LLPETEDEEENLYRSLESYYAHELNTTRRHDVEELFESLAPHLKGEELLLLNECVALVGTDLAVRAAPHLFDIAEKDKDKLVPLDQLQPIGPGVFKVGEFALFAHADFRRSQYRLNTLNTQFFSQLYSVQEEASDRLKVRVALDRDMVGLTSSYRRREELEYWWGPKFNDDLTSISPNVTHHEATPEERWYHCISRTEFWWQSRDGEHIFEAEELRDQPSPSVQALSSSDDEPEYACRYVHSIVQEGTGKIEHFDGSTRRYGEEQMLVRLDSKISEFGRTSKYTKLWRVDGSITVPEWKSLLAQYFRDNTLVGEYLGGKAEVGTEEAIIDRGLQEAVAKVEADDEQVSVAIGLTDYIPYTMARGDGVRVAWSCHPLGSHNKALQEAERSAVPLGTLVTDAGHLPVLEADTVELRKLLNARGASLNIPTDAAIMCYKDWYVNLPLIFHSTESLPHSLEVTLDALRAMVQAWDEHGFDLVASYSLGFIVEDREVRLSVLGHVSDLRQWLHSSLATPPLSLAGLGEWGEQVSTYLKSYPKSPDVPPLGGTLMPTGVLVIDRALIEQTAYQFFYSPEKNAHGYVLALPHLDDTLQAAFREGKITPTDGFQIVGSTCTKCGQPYSSCGCSKLIDEGVAQEITEVRTLFLFWTDRPIAPAA
jgi:hypothetical protein